MNKKICKNNLEKVDKVVKVACMQEFMTALWCLKRILHVARHMHQKWYYLELLNRFYEWVESKNAWNAIHEKKFTQLRIVTVVYVLLWLLLL